MRALPDGSDHLLKRPFPPDISSFSYLSQQSRQNWTQHVLFITHRSEDVDNKVNVDLLEHTRCSYPSYFNGIVQVL